jgi:molecular chaperone HtpG
MSDLISNAELKALEATKLPAFRGVPLRGLKDNLEEMLNMIGRTNEIFATYTKHDISHIDAMLKHLDWLIPDWTHKHMTPVDWLLITLSIYFHDLGMLVTAQEFEERMGNEEFILFMRNLEADAKSQDYLARARKMNSTQRERFFFQEFIREHHARRVREWINGRRSRHWGNAIKAITEKFDELMKPFPARFRENLATICESHHKNDLNNLEIYPLYQRYGSDGAEMANVQYAALILRTVDLIHVTKDRTPSIMYKTINLSDPKGVDEWDKQKDVFAVCHAGRKFDPEDESTHMIAVSADFTEERPFFALSEYISWADTEIKQTKRWSDQSKEHKDASGFWFPWQGIRGDLRVEGNQPQQMRFEFDRGRLLNLLVGHAIYNDATVAIRELLQNAIDAVRFQHHLDVKSAENTKDTAPPMGKVLVTWNPEDRRLTVEDNGIGMDLDIIKFHLMRVGSSFYNTPQFISQYQGFTPISRFGIGVLTCFMISDDIEIITMKSKHAHRIKMTSVHADYLLRDLTLDDERLASIAPHGTRVSMTVREGEKLDQIQVEEILRYWIVLPACHVYYAEAKKESVQIGYNSPTEALKSFYEQEIKQGSAANENLEIVSKRQVVEGAEYELAVVVKSGWLPEKTFAKFFSAKKSAVCIEGVSVSEILPGHVSNRYSGGRHGVLFSVRGARGLRTTVSRSNLEEDEDFLRVGKICVSLMFEHIRDEVRRISAEKGNSLSRASTAGKWLCQDLIGSISNNAIRDHVLALRNDLPFIVMEEVSESQAQDQETGRKLVSPDSLNVQSHFWTIESRLVDSLGIISRDLGRELSLFQFLNALAPDYRELRYSPILPDAFIFSNIINENHDPAEVQFSRQHQYTVIKWVPSEGKKSKSIIYQNEDFQQKVQGEYQKLSQDLGIDDDDHFRATHWEQENQRIAIANLMGDEPKVKIVKTRIVTILADGSDFAKIWEALQFGVEEGYRQLNPVQYIVFFKLQVIYNFSIGYRFNERRELENQQRAILGRAWSKLAEMANQIMPKIEECAAVPESFDFPENGVTFDASFYWRDWHRAR